MRVGLIVAIATVALVGAAAKIVFFSSSIAGANADAVETISLDISKMPVNNDLPVQKFHDMTFVFSDAD